MPKRRHAVNVNSKPSYTNRMKVLESTTRGRVPTKRSRSLHVVLGQNFTGPASLAKILCSIKTPSPSDSGVQKSANKVIVFRKKSKDIKLLCQGLRLLNNLPKEKFCFSFSLVGAGAFCL